MDNTQTYFGIDGFLEKINKELYFEGTVQANEFKTSKVGLIRQLFELPIDSGKAIHGYSPLILETPKVTFIDSILNCNDSDEIIKENIGNIHLYKGLVYKDDMNPMYFDKLVVNINKTLDLNDNIKLPKCKLTFYKEYDTESNKEYIQSSIYSVNKKKYEQQDVSLATLLPVELFTSKNPDSNIMKFWQTLVK